MLCVPNGAGELPIAANGVLPGNPALLVSDRAKGDVGRPVEESVVCFDAVTRRENIWKVRLHAAGDGDRAAHPKFRACAMGEITVGADADSEDDEIRRVVPTGGVYNRELRLFSARSLLDSHSADTGQNVHTVPLQFLPDHKAER